MADKTSGRDAPLAEPDAFTRAAHAFAEELSTTVQAVTSGQIARFIARVNVDGPFDAYVAQEDKSGVPLCRGGRPILRLEFSARVTTDRHKVHLKTVASRVGVFADGGTLPVFRYEFEETKGRGPRPAAHLQFHGSHPDLQRAMPGTRSRSTPRKGDRPDVADLHFPVGGTRFGPALRTSWRCSSWSSACKRTPRNGLEALRPCGEGEKRGGAGNSRQRFGMTLNHRLNKCDNWATGLCGQGGTPNLSQVPSWDDTYRRRTFRLRKRRERMERCRPRASSTSARMGLLMATR